MVIKKATRKRIVARLRDGRMNCMKRAAAKTDVTLMIGYGPNKS
jgi:hypothetical protein